MTTYELVYFNVRARAETARYLFALAGQEYTDTRLTGEQFAAQKKDLLYGGLPELRMGGDKKLCQSGTINRFLAKEFGLMGSNKREEFYIDMIQCSLDDITSGLAGFFFEKDEARKAEATKKFSEKLDNWLEKLEAWLSNNKGGDGWFVGDSPTLADAHAANCLAWLAGPLAEQLKKFPKLHAHSQRFFKLPKIAAYIAKRPESTF